MIFDPLSKVNSTCASLTSCTQNPQSDPFCVYNKSMNKTKSLFSQSINLCDDYLGFEWSQGVRTNLFDTYRRQNDLDPNLAIYHYGNDRFEVRTMVYTDKGCIVGDQIDLGTFDNIYDAEDCAETYLKDLLLDLGV